jgi:hypothetical protein
MAMLDSFIRMNHMKLIRSREKLAKSLPTVAEIIRGSLLHRTIRHSRDCPKCERGEGHRVWVLTVSYPGGKTKQFSLRPHQRDQVQQWLKNYQELKTKLEAICELNQRLLRPDE